MSIVQPKIGFSEATRKGLLEGVYIRTGGVVRDKSTMRIVEIGKDIVDKPNKKIFTFKNIGIAVLFVGVIILVYKGGKYLYKVIKNENINENLENEIIINQNELTNDYINEIQTGTLDKETLINLILNFKKIIDAKNKGLIIEIDIEKFNELLNILDKYTNELAKANNIDLNIDTMNSDDYLLDCVKYLECQKQIFEMCELESEAISKW